MKIEISLFQRNNLLQFLNRVTVTGLDENAAFQEIINIIRNAEETNRNIPTGPAPVDNGHSTDAPQ